MTLINGRAYKKKELLDEGTPVLRIQNLNGKDNWYYSDLQLPDNKYCDNGDLLFAWSASFGPYIWNGSKSIYHYHIWKILPQKKILDTKFAYYLLLNLTEKIKNNAHGIAMLHITKTRMEELKLSIPPIPKQIAIAKILDAAAELKQKDNALIAKYNELSQSLFLDMFGHPALNPKKWKVCKLKDVTICYDSKRVPVKKADRENMAGEYPYYGATGIIDHVDDYIFNGEYLLISEDGKNLINRTKPLAFIAKGKFWVNNHAHILKASEYSNIRYLRDAFENTDIGNYITGIDQYKLNRSNMDKIPIPIPPIDLQNKFANRIQSIEKQKNQAQASLKKSEELFNCLLQKAFKGELVT